MRSIEGSRTKLNYKANQAEQGITASSALLSYQPKSVDKELWSGPIGDFVRSYIAGLDVPAVMEIRYARVLALISEFAIKEGTTLDIESVLDPDTVERFVATGLKDKKGTTRATYRALLRSLDPSLTDTAPWEPAPSAWQGSGLAPPYANSEEQALRRDMVNQATPALTTAAIAIIALGLGAGLDGRWIPAIQGTDIKRQAGFVVVHVPKPNQRVVVVRKRFETDVLLLAERMVEKPLIRALPKQANTVGNLTARMIIDQGRLKVHPRRLRSSWLLAQLEGGVPLPELLETAGLKGSKSLADLVPYMRSSNTSHSSRGMTCPPRRSHVSPRIAGSI